MEWQWQIFAISTVQWCIFREAGHPPSFLSSQHKAWEKEPCTWRGDFLSLFIFNCNKPYRLYQFVAVTVSWIKVPVTVEKVKLYRLWNIRKMGVLKFTSICGFLFWICIFLRISRKKKHWKFSCGSWLFISLKKQSHSNVTSTFLQ